MIECNDLAPESQVMYLGFISVHVRSMSVKVLLPFELGGHRYQIGDVIRSASVCFPIKNDGSVRTDIQILAHYSSLSDKPTATAVLADKIILRLNREQNYWVGLTPLEALAIEAE